MSTILQLARDLGGNQWIQYDKVYREWAAAKEIKVWGELNLSIFGHCLASQYRAPLLPPAEKEFRPAEGKREPCLTLGHRDVACGILRADAPSPSVNFSTIAISVGETTEEINAHHLQGRVLMGQDDKSDGLNL